MRRRVFGFILLLAIATAGCGTSNTSGPSDALTASVVAPRPAQPANNASIKYSDQPVTLVVQNATSTAAGVTYTVEVATDAAFGTKVQTKDSLAEGAGGSTSVKLDALTASKDYYWHARAVSGGTVGLFGPVFKFTVGPSITISTPNPISPLTNAQTGPRPALRVTNVTRTGPVGVITYKFEISTTPSFATVVITGTMGEGVNETGYIPSTDLTSNTLYYWRATALDVANGIASAPSSTQSFTPVNPLWPGAVPPGTNGHATLGPGWQPQTLVSFNGQTFTSPPIDEQRVFDLLDRGFDPQGAINWMNGNGYPTVAVYYPGPQVIGFNYTYMALINGVWELCDQERRVTDAQLDEVLGGVTVFTLACAGVVHAQTAAQIGAAAEYPAPEDRGYFAFVGQAAFSNVTSQSYGIEAGVAVAPHFQVYTDIGFTRDVAPASLGAAAQTIAGALSNLQPNVGYSVKEPATFAVFGVRYAFGVSGSAAKPYVMAGIGAAHLKREATFTVAGADVTSNLGQDPFGNIVLGSDLAGSSNSAMFEFGGGVALPLLSHLLIDLQVRYGRLFASPDGINVTRAGLGVGVRF